MVAQRTIALKGNRALVDSFDSTNPSYSTNGQYHSSRRKANALLGSNSDVVNAISGGKA